MFRYLVAILLTLILLPGCSREEKRNTTETSPAADAVEKFAPPPPATAGPVATGDPKVLLAMGERYYLRNCASCHDQEVGGAPRIGDVEAWRGRIALGESVLIERAINGHRGVNGVMPPRGGNPKLRAEAVALATHYLASRGKGNDTLSAESENR